MDAARRDRVDHGGCTPRPARAAHLKKDVAGFIGNGCSTALARRPSRWSSMSICDAETFRTCHQAALSGAVSGPCLGPPITRRSGGTDLTLAIHKTVCRDR